MILPYPRMDRPIALAIFDIDGVVRDVSGSYRRAIADTVEAFTNQHFRPTIQDIDELKAEGVWNNDWKASEELVYRYLETQGQKRTDYPQDYEAIIRFFQQKYRGDNFDGYIQDEPILMDLSYLETLTKNQIGWGFFSGATRGSAQFILERRIGIPSPVLVAMEDAPGKPDPTGLFQTIHLIQTGIESRNPNLKVDWSGVPVCYVGDTTADLQTAINAGEQDRDRPFIPIGVLPPHALGNPSYVSQLKQAGAADILNRVVDFSPERIQAILLSKSPMEDFIES